jgi:hypothetical protein
MYLDLDPLSAIEAFISVNPWHLANRVSRN